MAPKGKKAVTEEVTTEEQKCENGVFILPDGSRYDGGWTMVGDKRCRQGVGIYTSDSCVYNGEWKTDKMHGKGKIVYPSKDTYNGDWIDNVYEGEGTYLWANGSKYTGGWRKSKMHGAGTYIDANGMPWLGTFCDGEGPGLMVDHTR